MNKTPAAGFANEIHQLLVSVSRHLYLTARGLVKYQEKPMEPVTGNFACSRKERLVYYVLRDAYSGNFIFQVATTAAMIPLADFLYFGWKEGKEEDHFRGLPLSLSVPKRISSPGLLTGLRRLDVEPFHPSSGFASGIRILRDLEENLCFEALGRSAIHTVDTFNNCKSKVYRFMLEGAGRDSKLEQWRGNLIEGHPRAVPEYREFISLFPATAEANKGLPLVASPGEGSARKKPRLPAFLAEPIENIKYSPEKLARAGELLGKAMEAEYRDTLLRLACEALELSPYCTGAYNLLAEESDCLEEKTALYWRGARAGELSLGELFFKKNVGHFWGIMETRPYMRALEGLAGCLCEQGRRTEAIDIYREMLRLNPADNQGIRYKLALRLLDEGLNHELESLFRTYHQEESCFMLYSMALGRFRSGDGSENIFLRRAMRANKHVPAYLLGEERVPYRLPDYFVPGSEEEAQIYAGEAGRAWRETGGALDWLRERWTAYRKEAPVRAASPNIAAVLQEFLEEQAGRLGEKTLGKYENAVELLQHCLNSYGHQYLETAEQEMLERYEEDGDNEEKFNFSTLFGPEKIPGIVGEFLGYFMVRKVFCGKDQLRTTGTVIKKLAGWLADRGYITGEEAEDMAAKAAEAYRELPAADDLSEALFELVESSPPVEGDEEMEDLFSVVKVEPGKLYLEAGAEEPVVVAVPRRISSLCCEGWMIPLLLVKTASGWRIAEAGRVYPI